MRHDAATGFDGKLPSRGDFVSAGLPSSFLKPWRAWVEAAVHASRQMLGEDWVPAWLEAPIWHFACAPGVAGPDAALGLIFPSVDRAGRHFPMTIAAVCPGFAHTPSLDAAAAWLAEAEAAGLDALMTDTDPAALGAALRVCAPPAWAEGDACASTWRTLGSPRVEPASLALPALPPPASFAAMIASAPPPGATLSACRAQPAAAKYDGDGTATPADANDSRG
jgi:type VI secretion system protein ImpM